VALIFVTETSEALSVTPKLVQEGTPILAELARTGEGERNVSKRLGMGTHLT